MIASGDRRRCQSREGGALIISCRIPIVAWMLVLCVTTACAAATARTGKVVMGTVLEVTVVAADPVVARTMADRAISIAQHWDDVLTIWRLDGELARLNARAGQGPVAISADLRFALTTMRALAAATSGAFDPAVGPLVVCYSDPSVAKCDPDLPHRIADVLELDGDRAALAAGAALDPGGVGKGIALDAMAAELRRGAQGAFLDFGGSSQWAFGRSETGEPWRVAVAGLHPDQILGILDLDGALSTSRARPRGDASGPIVDPRTGMLVGENRLASCLAASAAAADAWSTALIVLGPEALATSEARGVAALAQTAEHAAQLTPEFARKLRPVEYRKVP